MKQRHWTGNRAAGIIPIPFTDFTGSGWETPDTIIIFFGATGLPPSMPYSITLQPTGKFDIDTSLAGSLGDLVTLSNNGNYKLYDIAGGGTVNLANGLAQQSFTATVNYVALPIVVNIDIFIYADPYPSLTYDVLFLAPFGMSDSPGVLHFKDLGWSSDYLLDDNVGFHIESTTDLGDTWDKVATIPPVIGGAPHELEVPEVTDAIYRVRAFNLVEGTYSAWSEPSSPLEEEEELPPDILHTPSGGLNLGTTEVGMINLGHPFGEVLITDPSGIYTLIPGKRNDTLYNRAGDESVDVKIPNPYGITGFLP